MTSDEHNKYLSWTFLGNGLFQTFMLVFIYSMVLAYFLLVAPSGPSFSLTLMAIVFGVAFIINLALISPNFVAYFALKNRKPWARIASIVAGVLSAMNVPIGTAACAYSMWFFFGEEWKSVYPDTAGSAPNRHQLGYGGQKDWEGRYVRQDGEVVYQPSTPPDWR